MPPNRGLKSSFDCRAITTSSVAISGEFLQWKQDLALHTFPERPVKLQTMETPTIPTKWKLTENGLSKKPEHIVSKTSRVLIIHLHICLMLEVAFLVALGENLQYGENIGFLRRFFEVLLPTVPAVSAELAMGIVAVSYPAIRGIGVRLMLFFLFGAIIICFGYKQALKIYAILLGGLVCALIITAFVKVGSQTYLAERTVLYMKENLATYNDEQSAKNMLAVETWNIVMMEGGYYCCGLNGYKDFKGSFSIPTPCCSVDDNVLAESCSHNTAAALYPAVPGCTGKIKFYVDLIRLRFTVLSVSLLMPPVLVLIAVMFTAFF